MTTSRRCAGSRDLERRVEASDEGVPTAATSGNTVPGIPTATAAVAEASTDGTGLISYSDHSARSSHGWRPTRMRVPVYLHPRGRLSVAKRLAELGVAVRDGPDANVTPVTRDAVQLDDGRELPSEVTIWTAGPGVPDLADRRGPSTDALGRLFTDAKLTSVDDVRIIARPTMTGLTPS